MPRHIALLRAINVGGRNRVPMAELREVMERLGYTGVRTYVQSGNVVFDGPKRSDTALAARLHKELSGEFGFDIPVIVRTRDELAAIIEHNPLGKTATDPARLHVLFLATPIDAVRLEKIDAEAFAPDVCALHGDEIHLWTPDGIGDSKLARALNTKRLGTHATARNWRTVLKLLELADADTGV